MAITIKEITGKAQETLGLIGEKLNEYQNQALKLQEQGLDAEVAKLKEEKIQPYLDEQDRILRLYEEESKNISSKTLEGISSGETISDTRTEKRYVPSFGLSNQVLQYEQPVSRINNKKLAQEISRFTGKDPEKIDVTNGLGVGATINLEGLGDQKAQFEALNKKFGGRVVPLTVAGKNNFLVTDEDDVTRLVFPTGIQGADVAATAATEVGPLAAGIGAALGLASTGIGAGGSIPAFNAAYAATKGAQTAGFRAANESDIRPGQIAGQAGIDFALGSTIDYATLGTGKFVKNRFLTEGVENLVEADLKAAQSTLRRSGFEVDVPFTAKSGQRGLDFYNKMAARFPDSSIGKSVEATAQTLSKVRDKFVNGTKGNVAQQVVQKLDDDIKLLERTAKSSDIRVQNSVKNSAQRAFNDIAVTPVDQIKSGETFSDILTRGLETTRNAKNDAFDNFANEVDSAGILQTPEELAALLRPIVQNSRGGVNPVVNDVYTRLANAPRDSQEAAVLRNKINQIDMAGQIPDPEDVTRLAYLDEYSQPFDARTSRDLIRKLQAQLPQSSVGADASDKIARDATQAVRDNFEKKIVNTPLYDKWGEFKEAYTDFLSYEKGPIGKMLTDNFGELQIAPEKIIKSALTDSKSINDVLNAAKAAGDVQGEAFMRDTLQRTYLEELGIANNRSVSGVIKDPDPAKMQSLWGLRAKYVTQNIEDLKKLKGVDVSKISKDDAMELTKLMPDIEKRKLLKNIVVRDQAIKEEEKTARNFFIKELKKGNVDLLDSQAVLKSLAGARTSDVLDVFGKLPPKIRKDAGADMMALLFADYADTSMKTRLGQPLWNADKFNKTIGDWKRGQPNAPDIVSKLDAISGSSELADLFISASKTLGSVTPEGKPLYQSVRAMASPNPERGLAMKLYLTLDYLPQRLIAGAYGNDVLKPFLRSLSKNISEETYNRNANMMIKATLGTSAGIKASAQIARNDPEFAEQLPEIMRLVKEESIKSLEENKK